MLEIFKKYLVDQSYNLQKKVNKIEILSAEFLDGRGDNLEVQALIEYE